MTEQEAFDRCKSRLKELAGPFAIRVLPMLARNGWLVGLGIEGDRDMQRLLERMISHLLPPTVGWYTATYSSHMEVVILRTERDGVVTFHGSLRVIPDEVTTAVSCD